MNIQWAGKSVKGYVRENNEDSFGTCPERGLWVVSDGMGGHELGEIASKITVDVIIEEVKNNNSLMGAVLKAHEVVKKFSEDKKFERSPGATVCALKIQNGKWECVWVGDSRLWLWNGKKLTRLTTDHTRAWDLVRWGVIKEKDVAGHPARSVLTKCIGMKKEFVPERIEGDFKPGRYAFLLTTDGAVGHRSTEVMEKCLKQASSAEDAVEKIVSASLDAGGDDNITVVVVGWPEKKNLLKRLFFDFFL